MVRVHYDEGVAIHIGPESCAGGREAVCEALTGECAGQPLSHEKADIPGADAVRYAEGHTKGRAIASSPTTRRGRRPWHVQTLFVWDPRIIRLIRKWLRAGVLEDGVVTTSERGTGQGSVISPLLANIYLHYVFDLWAARWRRREATGDMVIVRYADDIVVGFEHEADGRRFLDMMRERLTEFALTLHPEKTRLIPFGRFAAAERAKLGLGKPETFDFLGLTHICGRTRQGRFQIRRKSRRDRRSAKLREIKDELRRRILQPIPEQGRWLKLVITGYYAYHAVPTNSRSLGAFRDHVIRLWGRTLRRRSQKHTLTWERMGKVADDWLPQPRILHPWPSIRFAVKHPR